MTSSSAPSSSSGSSSSRHDVEITIEHDLYLIFTFYALRADASTPEVWSHPTFMRFVKDCNILSKSLTPTAVDLEITAFARSRAELRQLSTQMSIQISFSDFLELLNVMAIREIPQNFT
jgi:hypothetical protein